MTEYPYPAFRDEDGNQVSQDEAVSRLILAGNAAEIPPARDYSELPVPEEFGDYETEIFGPGEALGGYSRWNRNRMLRLLNGLSQDDQSLIWRHAVNGQSFALLASEEGTSRQAVRQRFERLARRLRQAAAELCEPDDDEIYGLDAFELYDEDE